MRMFLFADDTTCATHLENSLTYQEDLDPSHSWSINNSMRFNLTKCELLSVGQKLSSSASNLTIKDKLISLVDHHKDLGVVFSHDLTYNQHTTLG